MEGLYDDLNEFKFDKLKDHWADKLSHCQKFRDIIEEINKLQKNYANRQNGNYHSDKDKDNGIVIDDYIKEISQVYTPEHCKPVNPSEPKKKQSDEKINKITGEKVNPERDVDVKPSNNEIAGGDVPEQ